MLGVSPVSIYQLYGVYVAFHLFHSIRVSPRNCVEVARAFVQSCPIGQHLIKAKLGIIPCKFVPPLPPSSLLGSSPTASVASAAADSADSAVAAAAPPPPALQDVPNLALRSSLNLKLRFSHARYAKHRASGVVPAGPLLSRHVAGVVQTIAT